MITNDWLEFIRLNSRELADNSHFDILAVVFWYGHIAWGMMLLIRHKNMTNQWTFRGKK